jgi:hypothetical protein
MHNLTVNGLDIRVYKSLIKIFDKFSDISEAEVDKIVNYLQLEGFLDDVTRVRVVVIQKNVVQTKNEKKCAKKI